MQADRQTDRQTDRRTDGQTDRQQSSVFYNLMQMEVFFSSKKRISLVSTAMGDSSQFSPLTTLSEQLGPNSWVSSVFIPAFIANIGKHFLLKYDSEYSKSI